MRTYTVENFASEDKKGETGKSAVTGMSVNLLDSAVLSLFLRELRGCVLLQ